MTEKCCDVSGHVALKRLCSFFLLHLPDLRTIKSSPCFFVVSMSIAQVVERQHKADAKTAQGVINTHLSTIQGLEDQGAAAHAEIEFLVEENHELAREIECHHMYGEEMMQRYLTTFSAAERHLEYSRFLEEELFCARKLYEKSSTQYNGESKGRRGSVGAGAGNSVSDMFGDMSEESYVYRNSFKVSVYTCLRVVFS